jgi:tRNA(Ile)-lysidine synthase TilS/MesJ
MEFDMIPKAEKIAVALSGGKDSLSLLFLLHAIRGRGLPPFDLVALTVTGEQSCGPQVGAETLQTITKRLEVPLITLVAEGKQKDCYSCSRQRRSLLFEAAKKTGATRIAFGHHRDDSSQTTLMNLFLKAEFAGLLPKIQMKKYGVTIIRPLILAPEKLIIQFAKKYDFARITCQCPLGTRSARKKVDLFIEEIETLYPNARANIATAALQYGSKKAALTSIANQIFREEL